MRQTHAASPAAYERGHDNAQVMGGNILSLLAAMGAFRRTGEQLLAAKGIDAVTPDGWYSLEAYVQALDTIERKIGPNTLFKIGLEIPKHIPLPPGLDSFEAVIGCFGPAFEMNHRGAAGNISHEITGPQQGRIISGTPYPCDFDRGVIQGFFTKLLGPGFRFSHDQEMCKKKGKDRCIHLVQRWAVA